MREPIASPSPTTTPGRPVTLSFGELAEWLSNVANGDAFSRRADWPLTMIERGVAVTLALQEAAELGVTPRELLVSEAFEQPDTTGPGQLLNALDALQARGLIDASGWPVMPS